LGAVYSVVVTSEYTARRYRAGDSVEDLCRACKIDRIHTVMVAGQDGRPLRVVCDYCRSEHNFRGTRSSPVLPSVTPRERTAPVMAVEGDTDLEVLIRRIIREEAGLTPVAPAEKWRGGQLVLKPGREGLQEKAIPIETFFNKIVMVRNRLRTLEQQVNASDLPDDVKVKLQGYVTGCYGSLTSFNVLFADPDDHFKGSGE
jgi:hypothetical protein